MTIAPALQFPTTVHVALVQGIYDLSELGRETVATKSIKRNPVEHTIHRNRELCSGFSKIFTIFYVGRCILYASYEINNVPDCQLLQEFLR